MLCLCAGQLKVWFQTDLGCENSASCYRHFSRPWSRVGHALSPIFMLWLVKIWQVSSCAKFMQHQTKETFVWLAVWISSVQSSYRAQDSKQRWLPLAAIEKVSCSSSSIVRSSKDFWQELLIIISQIAGKIFRDCFSRQGVFSLAHERGLSCKSESEFCTCPF